VSHTFEYNHSKMLKNNQAFDIHALRESKVLAYIKDYNTHLRNADKYLHRYNPCRYQFACFLLEDIAISLGQVGNGHVTLINPNKIVFINSIGEFSGSMNINSDIDITIYMDSVHPVTPYMLFENLLMLILSQKMQDNGFGMNIYSASFLYKHNGKLKLINNIAPSPHSLAWSLRRAFEMTNLNTHFNIKLPFKEPPKRIRKHTKCDIQGIKSNMANVQMMSLGMHLDAVDERCIRLKFNFALVNALKTKKMSLAKLHDFISDHCYTYAEDQYLTLSAFKDIVLRQCSTKISSNALDFNHFEQLESAFENLGFLLQYIAELKGTEFTIENVLDNNFDSSNLESGPRKCFKYMKRVLLACMKTPGIDNNLDIIIQSTESWIDYIKPHIAYYISHMKKTKQSIGNGQTIIRSCT